MQPSIRARGGAAAGFGVGRAVSGASRSWGVRGARGGGDSRCACPEGRRGDWILPLEPAASRSVRGSPRFARGRAAPCRALRAAAATVAASTPAERTTPRREPPHVRRRIPQRGPARAAWPGACRSAVGVRVRPEGVCAAQGGARCERVRYGMVRRGRRRPPVGARLPARLAIPRSGSSAPRLTRDGWLRGWRSPEPRSKNGRSRPGSLMELAEATDPPRRRSGSRRAPAAASAARASSRCSPRWGR